MFSIVLFEWLLGAAAEDGMALILFGTLLELAGGVGGAVLIYRLTDKREIIHRIERLESAMVEVVGQLEEWED